MGVVKKPQSAYFQFSGERRKQIVEENPGLRVGEIQKLITAQWKELSDEEKQRYIDLAAKDKERYERERLENPVDVEAEAAQQKKDAEAEGNVCLYPLGRVKRIVQSDPDVNKVSREALIAISKASELFAQFLATKSYEQTLFSNKRQIKAADVTRAIQITSVLDWLREDFPDIKQAAPAPTTKATASSDTTNGKGKATASDVAAFFRAQASESVDVNAEGENGGAAAVDGSVESASEPTVNDAEDMDES